MFSDLLLGIGPWGLEGVGSAFAVALAPGADEVGVQMVLASSLGERLAGLDLADDAELEGGREGAAGMGHGG